MKIYVKNEYRKLKEIEKELIRVIEKRYNVKSAKKMIKSVYEIMECARGHLKSYQKTGNYEEKDPEISKYNDDMKLLLGLSKIGEKNAV